MEKTPVVPAAPVSDSVLPSEGPLQNRFHLAAVAFLRAKQLQAGARPRVAPMGRQKPVTVALREVLADTISWSVEDAPAADA